MQLKFVLLAIHVLSAVGVFGGTVILRWGFPGTFRRGESPRRAFRLLQILLGLALLSGFALYAFNINLAAQAGGKLPSASHMLVGIKMLILLAVGGALGAASALTRKGKAAPADAALALASVLLAVAVYLGVRV